MDTTIITIIFASILGFVGGASTALVSYWSNRTKQHQIIVDAVVKMHQHACEKMYDPMHQATRQEAVRAYEDLVGVIRTALNRA